MISGLPAVKEVEGLGPGDLTPDLLQSSEPLILRQLVKDWPLVQAGLRSNAEADAYIRSFYQDTTIGAFVGGPESKGRVYYNDDLSGFNYRPVKLKLNEVLDTVAQLSPRIESPFIYVGSTNVEICLPGFRAENDLELGDLDPLVSLWLGNRTRIAAHYDVPDNIACCVVGHRRFTLFPPEQISNLYVGPLDFTPGGQAISMVDFDHPDHQRFPRFREALNEARVADMSPGDALFIPSMWWHHVEAQDDLNVLINYWWRQSPGYMDSPANVLEHAILGLRDLPEPQRKAWKSLFDYYVFDFADESVKHIPESRRGVLSPLDDIKARKLRAQLLRKLNR